MTKFKTQSRTKRITMLATAVSAAVATMAMGQNVNTADFNSGAGIIGAGREYLIQTTGATALNTFTSAAGNSGTFLLGQPELRIGNTVYTSPSIGVRLGIVNKGSINSAIDPDLGDDRLVYSYHNLGSVNGVRDVAIQNGLLPGTVPAVSTTNQLFVMGAATSVFPASLSNGYANFYDSTTNNASIPTNTTAPGAFTISGGNYDRSIAAKPRPQIAWSDVRAEQAFSQAGTGAVNAAPLSAGYGKGPSQASSGLKSVFQELAAVGSLTGGLDTSTTHLRNESLAALPFAIAANPGTGLDGLKEIDVKMLETKGRLRNGANFNFVSRDIGSGTRNQGANNFNIDPSWAGGERDRRYLGTAASYTHSSGVVVSQGDEQAPDVRITAASGSVLANEHRPSAIATFADKTSGTSGVRSVLLSSRMSLGVLSVSDVQNNSSGVNVGRANVGTTAEPLRVIEIDFDDTTGDVGNGFGFVLPTAIDITTGKYQHWSNAQAVTVAGSLATGIDGTTGNSTGGTTQLVSADTSAATGRSILNDVDDDGSGIGVTRKFLDNILKSIGGNISATAATPFEALAASGFMPTSLMKTVKTFEGGTQTLRILNPFDPDDTNQNGVIDGGEVNTPARSEVELYDILVNNSLGESTLNAVLKYANPGSHNGQISSQKYNIWSADSASSTADTSIQFTSRTFLAGDVNGDGVRDSGDVAAFAMALANPGKFIDDDTTGIATGATVTTIAANNLNTSAITTLTTGGRTLAGLLALTDLNGDGNTVVVDAAGADVTKPSATNNTYATWAPAVGGTGAGKDRLVGISRADVEYFLFGATIDTVGADVDEATAGVQTAASLAPGDPVEQARLRREIGVRTGQLVKNGSVATFNSTIDGLDATWGLTAANKADLKFEVRDVNQSGSRAFASATVTEYNFLDDALALDSVAGKDYTLLADAVSTPVDLTRANLTDANTTIGQEDADVINAVLKTDVAINPTGRVDHNWGSGAAKTGAVNLSLRPDAGTFTIKDTGGTLTIAAGTFEVGGTVNPFVANATGTSLAAVGTRLSVVGEGSGKLQFVTGGTVAASRSIGSLTLNGTSSLVLAASGQTGANRNRNVARIAGTATMAPGAKVDLVDNAIVFDGAAPSAAIIRSQIVTGRNGGGSGIGNWNGTAGITTSYVPTTGNRAVGYAVIGTGTGQLNLTSLPGSGGVITLAAGDVVVRTTRPGDANLDGNVNVLDRNIYSANVGSSKVWSQADFNYDGNTNVLDRNIYSGNTGTIGDKGGDAGAPPAGVTVLDNQSGNSIPNVNYNPTTGQLSINPDGFPMQTLFLELIDENDLTLANSDIDGPGGQSWTYDGFIGGLNWSTPFGASNFTNSGNLFLAQLQIGLGVNDFGIVVAGDPSGNTAETFVSVPEPSSIGLLAMAGAFVLRRRRRA